MTHGKLCASTVPERLLRETLENLLSLANSLPGALYRCRNDPSWTMDFLSEGILELTGYPRAALLDTREVTYGDMITPEHRAPVWDAVQAGLARRRAWEMRYQWERGLGIFEGGELAYLAGYIVDVESQVQAEIELARRDAVISALSMPVLEIWEGTLVVPIIGEFDQRRSEDVLVALLERLQTSRAGWVLLDVTGVPRLSPAGADLLLRVDRATRLLGARCVVTGVQPHVARTLAELDSRLRSLQIARTLKDGLSLRLGAA